IDPADALHICGAAHSASDVIEFGVESAATWDIPERTSTPWLYGLLPSSHAAIDWQFGFPPGTVTLAGASWEKGQRALGMKPLSLSKKPTAVRKAKPAPAPVAAGGGAPPDLLRYLARPPALVEADEEQLLS